MQKLCEDVLQSPTWPTLRISVMRPLSLRLSQASSHLLSTHQFLLQRLSQHSLCPQITLPALSHYRCYLFRAQGQLRRHPPPHHHHPVPMKRVSCSHSCMDPGTPLLWALPTRPRDQSSRELCKMGARADWGAGRTLVGPVAPEGREARRRPCKRPRRAWPIRSLARALVRAVLLAAKMARPLRDQVRPRLPETTATATAAVVAGR